MKQTSEERPPTLVYTKGLKGMYASFVFNVKEVEEGYEYEDASIIIDKAPLTDDYYGAIVSAIIRESYSADDVEAITQNYLADESAEHVREFNALQDWRALAKSEAKTIIEYAKNME